MYFFILILISKLQRQRDWRGWCDIYPPYWVQ